MATDTEQQAMRRALAAAGATHRTRPNPRVGCVLLDAEGRQIAVGAHQGAGSPHAEVAALAAAHAAGAEVRGATAVVTLEPCDHTGRTGPCSRALLDAGVARVVFGQSDPNEEAAGGASTLVSAGVDVEGGVLADEAHALNVEWTHALTTGRPFVTWKYAATLDGLSAAPDGSSRWITSAAARRDVHAFRAEVDAVVAGTGTVLADDPLLTVRDERDLPLPYDRQPLRVVVGESPVPEHYRVLDDSAPTLLVQDRDPAAVLARLAERGIRHVWLEGGPRLAGAFWSAGLVDRVVGYIAPAVLGAGRPALEAAATSISDLRHLHVDDLTRVGPDIRIIGTPERAPREEQA